MSSQMAGEYYLTIVDANVIKGFDLFTKSDLYVKIKTGDKTFKTKTCRNSECPVWNESFSFPMINQDIEVRVLDNDLFKDDKIAVANIYYDQFPTNVGEEKEYSIPLSYENKDVGILHIRIKNQGGNQQSNINHPSNVHQSNYIQNDNKHLQNANINANNASGFDGHSYNHNNHNNPNATVVNEQYYEQPAKNMNVPLNAMNPDYVAAIPSAEIKTEKKHKKERKHKDKHPHHVIDVNVVLPEKHHHYEDGLTSSSSESSNEGEKQRAVEGKLGAHAYDPPIDNNEPYINNTVPVQSQHLSNDVNYNSNINQNKVYHDNVNKDNVHHL